MKVFLSGPFFNDAEVRRIGRAKQALEALGLEVYSTSHRNPPIDLGSEAQKKKRFELLCREIAKSDGVFAVLDGRDAGTIWEMGYAFALGKPVVAFTERKPFFSLMIDGSALCISGFDAVDAGIEKFYLKSGSHKRGRNSVKLPHHE
jgi:nucleoside 2-deoxyribosyltransferase